MEQRYIQRCRLERRQFMPGCPVELDAGALLEDTLQRQLVAQLRFNDVSGRTIKEISVTVNTISADGRRLDTAVFVYKDFEMPPFGRYGDKVPVLLPLSAAQTMEVLVNYVVFADGMRYTLPTAGTAQAAKRKKKWLIPVIAAAAVIVIAAVLIAVIGGSRDGMTALPGGSDITAQPDKEELPAGNAAADDVPVAMPDEETVPVEPTEEPAEDPPVEEVVYEPVVGPTMTGETVRLYADEDENGIFMFDPYSVQDQYPQCATSCFFEIPYMGTELDTYIKQSDFFNWLIVSGTEAGLNGSCDGVIADRTSGNNHCLLALAYEDKTPYIVGFYVGPMNRYDEDTWYVDLEVCKYDLTELYAKEKEIYDGEKAYMVSNYIEPENAALAGTEYVLFGNHVRAEEFYAKPADWLYLLWNRMNSRNITDFLIDLELFEDLYVSEGWARPCVLLDADYNYIGYTCLEGK